MTFVVQMLAHTPPYVFVLLAYLIWQGALALRTRQRSVWRLLNVPVLFTATGLSLLVLRPLVSNDLTLETSCTDFWFMRAPG